MNRLFSILTRCSIFSLAVLISPYTCAATEYRDLSATFKASVCAIPCEKPETNQWYLWRTKNRIETRVDSNQLGEIWRRDEKGRMSFVYIEPAYKRGIEYNDTDLRMVNHKRSWDKLASIITQDELNKLVLSGDAQILGYKAQKFTGNMDDHNIEVLWVPDLQVAAKIVTTYKDRQVTNEIISTSNLPASVKPLTEEDLSNFELVDFADLGDMETKESMGWLKKVELAPGVDHHDH